ncbi:MAG: hypothetical protein JRI87_08295, partial [Deltaproteobacteria bacterium]|nr:hypothetical protein [Deltaproteobacteria bacterium]
MWYRNYLYPLRIRTEQENTMSQEAKEMNLRYEYSPHLKAEQVARLRELVNWDGRVDKFKKKLGNT